MPLHLRAFALSNNKRIINNFIRVINGFETNDLNYGDTASRYIEKKHPDKLDKAGLFGKNLLQGKNDYENDCGIFFGLFLARKKILFNY